MLSMLNCDVKQDEQNWYRAKARRGYRSWDEIYPSYLKRPYIQYLQYIKDSALKGHPRILELCCGIGEFSFQIADMNPGTTLGIDFSAKV